jgi:hypothetical protein
MHDADRETRQVVAVSLTFEPDIELGERVTYRRVGGNGGTYGRSCTVRPEVVSAGRWRPEQRGKSDDDRDERWRHGQDLRPVGRRA